VFAGSEFTLEEALRKGEGEFRGLNLMSDTSTDKRHNSRAKVSFSCTFGPTEDTPRSGTVTSLSTSGCFVKTRAWAEKGAKMYVKIWLPERSWLTLRSTVLYHMEQIGLGLGFDELLPEDEQMLRTLIDGARGAQTGAPPEGGDGEQDANGE
jgi:hypothetical protein